MTSPSWKASFLLDLCKAPASISKRLTQSHISHLQTDYFTLIFSFLKSPNHLILQGAALQEIAADVEELQRAEEMVKFQLRHGNDLLAMDSLRDCDVNVKEQGRLLRQNEFLVWQGRSGRKSLRQIFLFEDLVLFSKARRFPDQKVRASIRSLRN